MLLLPAFLEHRIADGGIASNLIPAIANSMALTVQFLSAAFIRRTEESRTAARVEMGVGQGS